MKIYFGFTVAGDRGSLATARLLVERMEMLGHTVLTRHLIDDNAREADRRLAAHEVYERDMRWLEECDLFLGEVSGSSFGIGFEAGYLLGGTQKPVILFYRRDLARAISLLITGNRHPRCALAPYDSAEDALTQLEAILRSSL
ncbi:MAG: nucleoside 2-deoxyribosyltransferase [Acidobacteria bacterium]|nr:nucleoside 2-deoxyribosyltransferase [Acidobacteriota bacterium]